MNDALQLIKPKRLYEDKVAVLLPDKIILELGATRVVAPAQTGFPASIIAVKDLFSDKLELAESIGDKTVTIPDLSWVEVTINAQDVSMFSAISAAGEDTFFCGKLGTKSKSLFMCATGWRYKVDYEVPKIFQDGTSLLFAVVDWDVFYYLFQMFKHLSGKKLDKLSWANDNGLVYLTNEARSMYVICNTKDPRLVWKYSESVKVDTVINKAVPKNTVSETKKSPNVTNAEALIKHLLRPLPENWKIIEYDWFDKHSCDYYSAYILKEKDNDG